MSFRPVRQGNPPRAGSHEQATVSGFPRRWRGPALAFPIWLFGAIANLWAGSPNPFPPDLDPFAPPPPLASPAGSELSPDPSVATWSQPATLPPPLGIDSLASQGGIPSHSHRVNGGEGPASSGVTLSPPTGEAGVTLTLASCPVSLALQLVTAGRPGGFVMPARRPEPLVTVTLVRRPLHLALRDIGEQTGFGTVTAEALQILTSPHAALFSPRYAAPAGGMADRAITLEIERTDLDHALTLMAKQTSLKVVRHPDLVGTVTARVREVPVPLALFGLALAVEGECGFTPEAVYLAPRGRLSEIMPPPATPSSILPPATQPGDTRPSP